VKQTELAVVKGNSIKQLKATNWSLKRLLLCNTKNQKPKSKRARKRAAVWRFFALKSWKENRFTPTEIVNAYCTS
jgi:hypothetical protein